MTSTRSLPSPAGHSRLLLPALCLAAFLAALNFYAATPFFSDIGAEIDVGVPLLGQITTALILISAVLGLFVGPLSDRYGFRRPLLIGVVAIAVNLIGTGLSPSYPLMLGFSLAGGLGDALVFGLPLAVAGSRFVESSQRKAMGWIIGSFSCAPLIGIPILTNIAGIAGWRTALVSAGLAATTAAWFIGAAMPPDPVRETSSFRFDDMFNAYRPLLAHASTLRLYCATALRAVTWIGLLTYLGAYLKHDLDLRDRTVGLFYTVSGVGYAVGSYLAGSRLGSFRPRGLIAWCCAAGGFAVAAILLIPDAVWVAVILTIASAFSALSGIGIATRLSAESPAGSGTTMVLNGSMLNLGAAAGSALGGGLIATGGYVALGIGLPIFSVIAGALAMWPDRPTAATSAPPPVRPVSALGDSRSR